MRNRDKQRPKNSKILDTHKQKRIYLDLADKDWSSDISSSTIKTKTRENSLASNSSYNKVPFSAKLGEERIKKLYSPNERPGMNKV